MTARRWYPRDVDYRRIWEHLLRQHGVDAQHVRLDSGKVVRVGADAQGEAR